MGSRAFEGETAADQQAQRPESVLPASATQHLLALQRTAGNRAVARLLAPAVADLVSGLLPARGIQRAVSGGKPGQEVVHESGARWRIRRFETDSLGEKLYVLVNTAGQEERVYGDVRSFRLEEASVGLAGLFGADTWRALGRPGNNPTRPDFEQLRNAGRIAANDLMRLIPTGLRNQFEIEGRSQRGFKFVWQNWHVHGHEPDAGAQAGHVGGAQWVVRIQEGPPNGPYLLAQPRQAQGPPNQQFDPNWARVRGQAVAAASHIPLVV